MNKDLERDQNDCLAPPKYTLVPTNVVAKASLVCKVCGKEVLEGWSHACGFVSADYDSRLKLLEDRFTALESRLDYLSKLVVADIGERLPVDALALPERIADGEQIEDTYSRWRNGQKP